MENWFDWIPVKSPLQKGLFTRRPISRSLLMFLDFFFRLFTRKKERPIPRNPKNILICNIANLGDLIISTTVLPAIKKQYPHSEIGFLTASGSAVVLKGHPSVARIHSFDHWYLNRNRLGICKAILEHVKSSRRVLKELRKVRYDLAIDLYAYFPNAIPLLARTGIPVRIGYTSGGFSSLLTHPLAWNSYDRYMGYSHLRLLEVLGMDVSAYSPLPCYKIKKRPSMNLPSNYIVAHMGSSSRLKEWNWENWIELIQQLKRAGHKVVLTGQGAEEQKICDLVAAATDCLNFCNQLKWDDFASTIQNADLLISVDSVSVHIAAGAKRPTLVLFSGINAPQMWLPPYSLCVGLMNRVPCAPCFNKKGCLSMRCLKGIPVGEVARKAMLLIQDHSL